MTENGTYRNNNAVLIASRSLAQDYATEFEEMFSGQFGASSPADTPHPIIDVIGDEVSAQVEIYFAPEDSAADHIQATLSDAQSFVRFMAFQFTSEELADTLLDLASDGIQIVGILEARDADRSYSQSSRLVSGGVTVLTDGNPYIMHHKVIIVDDHTVILGSYNFTNNAEENNDENVLIIHDPEVAAAFLAEFARLSQEAQTTEQ